MAQYSRDKQTIVGKGFNAYNNLGQICQGQNLAPIVGVPSIYTVPKYCPSGPGPNYPPKYDALSHGFGYQGQGYFDLKKAYPFADCVNCAATMVNRPCAGFVSECNIKENYCGRY